MKIEKLYIKPLNKSFEVHHTNKMIKMALDYLSSESKMDLLSTIDDFDEQIKIQRDAARQSVDFPKNALNLTDDYAKKLNDDVEFDDLTKIDTKLALMIRGMSQKEADKALSATEKNVEADSDPKKSTGAQEEH
ncbi:phage tail tube assembly chaperone [Limosilactobacillus reuteri subsp. suis]|uniref:phage tail tube assembly chaperone n=1 Tax=Limosilactobacillus reuteri TaxID=1598 RepID=UPI00399313EE